MLRWSPPSKQKPTVQDKRYFSPTTDDLRALVFDYLCHGSHTRAARAYMRDSAIQRTDSTEGEAMDVDNGPSHSTVGLTSQERLRRAQLRREIRTQILSGKVDDAIALLRTYFPAVLSQDSHDHRMNTSTASSNTFTYIAPRSVDPTHLLLDLQILGFIEAARTIPLPYFPSSPSAPSSPIKSPIAARTSHVRGESGPNEQQQILLHKAQKLYSDASCLSKPEDRALYLKELADVTGLLAYPVPEESPISDYLSQVRREEMADQIEGAILYHTGELAVSKIELAVRQASVTWNWMNANDVQLPPPVKWPTGVRPPTSLAPTNTKTSGLSDTTEASTAPLKKSPDKEGEMRVPPFRLSDFLENRAQ